MTTPSSAPRFVPSPGNTLPDHFIVDRGPDSRLLVAIHGISRNAAEIASRFASDNRFDGFTILAPLFDHKRFGRYQQLMVYTGRIPADRSLIDLLFAMGRLPRRPHDRFALFGFSGGAQMAHRFAMAYPDYVDRVCAVAAGWYLMPDTELPYPYGLSDDPRFGGSPDAFLKLPITIAVGSRDTRIDQSLRQSQAINYLQGRCRMTRALRWVEAMRALAKVHGHPPMTEFVELPGGTHDFGQCVREAGLMDVAANAFSPS